MPPKLRQRRSQREALVHTEHSQVESAANVQGQDPPQPPPTDLNRETLPQNEGGNQEKPHQDSGSHEKETTFVTMSNVANLLKQEREKNPKEPRLFAKKPPYPTELLKQPFPEKYIVPTFSRFDGRKGSALVHISKFIDSMGAYTGNGDLCLREFSKSLDDKAYTWYTTLPPRSVKVWEDMVELFCGKYFQAEEKITLVNLHTTKQASGEDLLRYIHRFRDISLDCYANYKEGELVGFLQKARKTALSVKPHTEKPKEKKNQPQVLTVSTVNNKRKKSSERSFEEPPPSVPCTLEEMMAILNKWVADGVVKLPEVSKKATEEDKKNPKFCCFHQYVHHSIADCWTLRRKFHEKIQDGTLELPQARQKVHVDPFLKHKDRAVVLVVIHGSASDVDMDKSAAASTAMTPTAIKTLQRNHRFRSLFNQLGLNPKARTAAIEAIMAIAADSGAHCFTVEAHASRTFLETTNAITFTDEDMEVQYPDHRRPLYLSAAINEVQARHALVDTGSCINLIPLSTIQAAEISQKKIKGAPMEIKGFGGVGENTKGHIQLVLKVGPIVALTQEEIKDAPEGDLRDLLERKRKRRAEAGTSKSQPQCMRVRYRMGALFTAYEDAAEAAAADLEISAKEELEVIESKPVVQPMRTFHPEIEAQITQEVKKLLSAGFIKLIQHPRWLSNIVPVKKKNGQIRCCVDFRNLNKACPKDEFPLPNMDLLIDSAAGHAMFSFMDGFSGYNQIFMSPRDVEKTAFRTPIGNFYYTVMPFGLKNAGAIYQRAMTAMFHDMMHREIEDYIDDIVVKSKMRKDHFGILKKVFERCQLYKLKMNPLKCAFGVSAGKFLGFLVHQRGIDVDPARASAIATMKPPTTHKELKSFLGKLSYIRRFIHGLAAVTSTFTPLLKKGAPFHWSTECQEAFEKWLLQLSQYEIIAETPTAIKSQAIADIAQFPGEDNSSISDEVPGEINEVFLAGLADSVWTLKFDGSSTAASAGASIVLYKDDGEAVTKFFKFDFPCSNNAAEYEAYLAGLAIAYEMGIKHLRVIGDSNLVVCQVLGEFSLKEPSLAPYRALAQKLEAKFSTFEIERAQRNENRYADALATLGSQIAFEDLREIKDYTLISGDLYRRLPGGVLARCISLKEAKEKLPEVHEKTCGDGGAISLYRTLQRLGYFWPNMSVEATEVQSQYPTCQFHYSNKEVCATFVSTDWRTPFLEYLLEGILPSNPKDVYRLKRLALRYFVEGGTLFRKGFNGEPFRCLSLSESQMVVKKTHAGECGEHQGKKRLYQCLLTLGYYWPTMKKDAADFVKTCHTCQGLDLIGPINPASGGYIWILVATKYFTKWVEAIPLRKTIGAAVANFIREHIITRFGIPYKLISDNGTPFINKDVREVLEHYRVKHRRFTPYYPQGNGQAEATNKMLLRILSKMVFDYGNDWRAHLADVLWAYRSSPKTATGFTPFSLVYGTDTISPTELVVPSPRVMQGRQMVLKAAEFVRRNLPSPSKFSPNWDGPYVIREAHGSGYYKLSKSDGTTLADPINGKWLKHYYS
uniref:Integrase catalytic domain-containing protein n=1 Tax=Fagus sylvatica TaxID=28930 RepID=A0A2N9IE29_FAGSY